MSQANCASSTPPLRAPATLAGIPHPPDPGPLQAAAAAGADSMAAGPPGREEACHPAILALLEPAYRSPLRVWMAGHFDELWPVVSRLAQPNWPALAGQLADRGVMDGRGRPPTPRCVRDAWRNVIAARQARCRTRQDTPLVAPE